MREEDHYGEGFVGEEEINEGEEGQLGMAGGLERRA